MNKKNYLGSFAMNPETGHLLQMNEKSSFGNSAIKRHMGRWLQMNQRGQEGAGFRLLVEAILVVMILVIILSVVSQVEFWLWSVSEQRLFEGFSKALKSPDGSVIFEKDIVLKAGSIYTSEAFANSAAGIGKECIELQSSDSTAFKRITEKAIEIESPLKTPVYYKCLPGYETGSDECETYCIVSFGEELHKEE